MGTSRRAHKSLLEKRTKSPLTRVSISRCYLRQIPPAMDVFAIPHVDDTEPEVVEGPALTAEEGIMKPLVERMKEASENV